MSIWRPPDARSYSHLLGMYLGDGCVSEVHGTFQFVVACDAAYPEIIEDCWTATALTLLPRRVHRNPVKGSRCVRVVAASPRWPEAFPQHGPGRKHARKIELVPWQREVVDRFPHELVCGAAALRRLPHDQPLQDEAAPTDIRTVFCETCDRLGVRWTQSNPRNISVSHRDSVALLDLFVPAKS